MSKGCKIWLWIILVCNVLSILLGMVSISANPKIGIYTVVAGIVMIAGIALLLFKQKKVGFYLMVAVAVVGVIFNIISGVNIGFALISAIIGPAITYYFITKNSNTIK